MSVPRMGLGAGWRSELALAIERRGDLGFVEVVTENIAPESDAEACLHRLRQRGLAIIPHGVSLSLGGAEAIDRSRVGKMDALARRFGSPFVSEHIAFVRAGGIEAGHLLPLPRTREALEVLIENVLEAKRELSVPLVLENIAALFEWPNAEMSEAAFLREALERTDSLMLLDLSNIFANSKNLGGDPLALLRELPMGRLAYCHVGGGFFAKDGVYHDTHGHAVPEGVFKLVEEFCARFTPPGIMIERDDNYPSPEEWSAEMDRLAAAMKPREAARAG